MKAHEILDVTVFQGQQLAKKIVCKVCQETVYEISERSTQAEVSVQVKGLHAHLEFRHGIAMTMVKCDDPKCLGDHQ